MANWAYTDYVIKGSKEAVKRIYDAIKKHPIQKDSHPDWEGNVLHALNIDFENIESNPYMRGFIQQDIVELKDDVLIFSAEEAWGATDFADVLNAKLDDIDVLYYVQEEGECIYATNDKDGEFFPDRYHVDACIDGNYHYEYFVNEGELYKWLKRISDGKITDGVSVDKFNEEFENSDDYDSNFIRIHEIKIIK